MAIDIGYVVFSGIFVVVVGLAALSWWKHSLSAAIVALVLIIVDGVLIQPWAFVHSHPSDGPYDQTWQINMRVISVLWLLVFAFIAANLARVIRHKRVKLDAHDAI